jgi:hypothetical protein
MSSGRAANCRACVFNRANRERARTIGSGAEAAHCIIRSVPISRPEWTYCPNFDTQEATPEGPIVVPGLYEAYRLIPWNGEWEPRTYVAGRCVVCGQTFTQGIEVGTAPGSVEHFCSNDHYIQWWRERHPEQYLVDRPIAMRGAFPVSDRPIALQWLSLDLCFSELEFEQLRQGFIPKGMDDRWFVFYEEAWLNIHRAGTGVCVFRLKLEKTKDGYRASEIWANQEAPSYRGPGRWADRDKGHLLMTILGLTLGIYRSDELLGPRP